MMLWKCCTQYASKSGKLNSGHRTGKGQFSFQSQRRTMPDGSNYRTIVLISYASKVMLKMSQGTSTVYELRTFRCTSWVLKRLRNQGSNCQHSLDHGESKRIPEKNIYSCFIDYTKAFDCVDHNKLEDSSKGGNSRPPYLSPEIPIGVSRSNS